MSRKHRITTGPAHFHLSRLYLARSVLDGKAMVLHKLSKDHLPPKSAPPPISPFLTELAVHLENQVRFDVLVVFALHVDDQPDHLGQATRRVSVRRQISQCNYTYKMEPSVFVAL